MAEIEELQKKIEMQSKFQQLKVDVDASASGLDHVYQQDQHGVRTNKKSDADRDQNEPLFTFTSGFDKADKQELRDTQDALDQERAKYRETIETLQERVAELQE